MAIYALGNDEPDIAPDAFVDSEAVVIGLVRLGAQASIWPRAVLRADHGEIIVGARTSIQDGTVLQPPPNRPPRSVTTSSSDTTPTSRDARSNLTAASARAPSRPTARWCAPGRSSVRAALIPEGFEVPSGALAVGVPARVRPLAMDPDWVDGAAAVYLELSQRHRAQLRRIS
jgi:carbonic anhydrase/acetyltransferase-like protein (isoleucine patch superfamily)